MKRYYGFMVSVAISLFVVGCMSVSNFQTAEVIPVGKISIGGGLNAMGSSSDEFGSGIFFPIPEIFGRYGLANNLDAGLKYTLPMTVGGDVKYQLTKLPLAIALDPAWSFFGLAGGEGFMGVLSLYPQVLFSTKMTFFGLKGMFSMAMAGIDDDAETIDTGFYAGGCVGLRLGTGRLSFIPELNYLVGVSGPAAEGGYGIFQGGMGFIVTF